MLPLLTNGGNALSPSGGFRKYFFYKLCLTLSLRRSLLFRNQFIDLLCKSVDWFLYGRDLRHEIVFN